MFGFGFWLGVGCGVVVSALVTLIVWRVRGGDHIAAKIDKYAAKVWSEIERLLTGNASNPQGSGQMPADVAFVVTKAARKAAPGISVGGTFGSMLEKLWWSVVNGRKQIAINKIDQLIGTQRVYIWYYTEVKPNADAVADAEHTIALLEDFRQKCVDYKA